jgi:hypothetical protein
VAEDRKAGAADNAQPEDASVAPTVENEVGYKKPPRNRQFRKGVSGNPKGRPPGSRSLRTELREVMETLISVQENGKKAKVTIRHAMLLRLRQQALAGDKRAIDRLLLLAAVHLPEPEEKQDRASVAEEDARLLARLLGDLASSGTGEGGDE